MKFKHTLMKKNISSILLLLLVGIGLIVSFGYLKPGLPNTDDGILMVIRASGFHESFTDGHIPVRWIQRLNENYGYPVLHFLYPLPFYLAEVFQLAGLSSLLSVKLIFAVATVLSGIGMYLFLQTKTIPVASFLGAATYILSPYWLFNLYTRGSLGEVLALSIVPWLFLVFETWKHKRSTLHFLLVSIVWSLLIVSHNSLALLFSLVFVLYIIATSFEKKSKDLFTQTTLWVTLTGLLTSWFFVPALHDLRFTRSSLVQISTIEQQFVPLLKLVSQVGILGVIVLFFSAVFLRKNKIALFWLVLSMGVLFLQLPYSVVVWKLLQLDDLFQFPFRFLSLLIFAVSFLSAYLVDGWHKQRKTWATLGFTILVLFSLLFAMYQIGNVENQRFQPGFFETNFDSTTNQKEFTPIGVEKDPTTYAKNFYEILDRQEAFEIVEAFDKTQEKYVQVTLKDSITLSFNTHFFPGWVLLVDDEVVEPRLDERGRPLIELTVPDRRNRSRTVQMVWRGTNLHQYSQLVSILTLLCIVSVLTYRLSDKNVKKTVGILSIIILFCSLSTALLSQIDQIKSRFDPQVMEQKYLKSQWVDPRSTEPLGDHGLYSWAGWAYIQGEDPTRINAEMPPLGKYLIGLGLWLTSSPAAVGLFFSTTFLFSLWFLSEKVLQDKWLAFAPLALISLEAIFRNSLTVTMLDGIQLTFLCLAFYALLRAEKNTKWFILANLAIGGAISSKFYATGVLIVVSVVAFYIASKKWHQLRIFIVTLPLVGFVHMASYWRYFSLGNTPRDYLGVQKWIFDFYRAGSPEVPLGSYWKLVFLNRWRVWWGPSFGEYYTLTTKEWNLVWPLQALVVLFLAIKQFRVMFFSWVRGKSVSIPSYYVLLSWLVVYAAFLTMIGGWPHYMLLFLPFSSIFLVKLGSDWLKTLQKSKKTKKIK